MITRTEIAAFLLHNMKEVRFTVVPRSKKDAALAKKIENILNECGRAITEKASRYPRLKPWHLSKFKLRLT
jgi:hypothetical protein